MGFQSPVSLEQQHRVEDFRCGVRSLDEWLCKHALQSHRSGGSRVYVTSKAGGEPGGESGAKSEAGCEADGESGAKSEAGSEADGESGAKSEAGSESVVGYYALAAGAVMPRHAPTRVARGLAANQPVPVVLLGRLAVDESCQGQHLGRSLLRDAMTRVLQAGELIGVRALLVHTIDERAREWYGQFGFQPSPTHPLHLTLLMKDIRATARQLPGSDAA